jgi:hypothetical protein
VTYVCVGREPPKGATVYHRCSAGWEVDLDVAELDDLRWGRPACPRCHTAENVLVRAVVHVIALTRRRTVFSTRNEENL